MPGMTLTPWGLAGFFRGCSCISIKRLPAAFIWKIRYQATLCEGGDLRVSFNSDGVGWAFLSTDLATNARSNLHGTKHHPGAIRPRTRDRTQALLCIAYFAFTRRTGHIETTYGTKIHTDATINTSVFIYAETIGHFDLLSKHPASPDSVQIINNAWKYYR